MHAELVTAVCSSCRGCTQSAQSSGADATVMCRCPTEVAHSFCRSWPRKPPGIHRILIGFQQDDITLIFSARRHVDFWFCLNSFCFFCSYSRMADVQLMIAILTIVFSLLTFLTCCLSILCSGYNIDYFSVIHRNLYRMKIDPRSACHDQKVSAADRV